MEISAMQWQNLLLDKVLLASASSFRNFVEFFILAGEERK